MGQHNLNYNNIIIQLDSHHRWKTEFAGRKIKIYLQGKQLWYKTRTEQLCVTSNNWTTTKKELGFENIGNIQIIYQDGILIKQILFIFAMVGVPQAGAHTENSITSFMPCYPILIFSSPGSSLAEYFQFTNLPNA